MENIQREDLNDVDRAASLLRLRKLMQEEVDAARRERGRSGETTRDEPWAGKVTWAKVGGRLGYSRQRIHQLIQLLDLPDEIKDAVRDGALSERDTRVYQGLTAVQQRALHRARMARDLEPGEVRQVSRLLREAPEMSVAAAIRLLRTTEDDRQPPTADGRQTDGSPAPLLPRSPVENDPDAAFRGDPILPARSGAPTGIDRLDYVRGHLARVDRHGLSAAERREMLRLLKLIQEDVASLLAALRQAGDADPVEF